MFKFERLLESIISENECKEENIIKFLHDHIKRLKNNPTVFGNELYIQATENKVDTFEKVVIRCKSLKESKVVKTREVDQLIADFRTMVSSIEGLLKYVFHKNTEVYHQFFPKGLAEVSGMTKEKLPVLLKRFEINLIAHESKIGIGIIEEFSRLKEEILAVRKEQLEVISKLDNVTRQKGILKKEVLSLFQRNLYFGYIQNFENPKYVKKLYNQNLLKSKPPTSPRKDIESIVKEAVVKKPMLVNGFSFNAGLNVNN